MRRYRPRLESLEARRMMAGTPRLLIDGDSICQSAPSKSNPNSAYLLTVDGDPFNCNLNNYTNTLVRSDGTVTGTHTFGRVSNDYINAFSVTEVGDDIYFVGGHFGGASESLYRVSVRENQPEEIPLDTLRGGNLVWGGVEIRGRLIIVNQIGTSIPRPENPNHHVGRWNFQLLAIDRNGSQILKKVEQTLESRIRIGWPVLVGEKAQFSVGDELWETDGTPDGTVFLRSPAEATVVHQDSSPGTEFFRPDQAGEFIVSLNEVNESREQRGELPIEHLYGFRRVARSVYFNARLEEEDPLDESYAVFVVDFQPEIPGDIDSSGEVDFDDFLILSSNFGKASDAFFKEGDIDGDRNIDFDDFLILAENFGRKLEDEPVDAEFAEV